MLTMHRVQTHRAGPTAINRIAQQGMQPPDLTPSAHGCCHCQGGACARVCSIAPEPLGSQVSLQALQPLQEAIQQVIHLL